MIEPVPREAIAPEVLEHLRPKMERLGYLGAFFTHTAHQPEALLAFLRFTDAVKTPLDDGLVEVVALTVATIAGNDYERHQHERLCLKLGFDRTWVADVEALRPDAPSRLTAAQGAVQHLAMAMIANHGRDVGLQRDAAVDLIGVEAAVGVMFLVGRYLTHAMIVNILELEPPVPSVFDAEVADAG